MRSGRNGPDLERLIDENHRWLAEFIRGNVEPAKAMFSHRDDVTLAGPQPTAHRGGRPIARGWQEVSDTLEQANAFFREGEVVGFENLAKYASAEFACTVEIERFMARVGERPEKAAVALRVTSVFRREPEGWRVVHRHADPVTSTQAPESITQR
jgi:ketosteroid isomerase-like protein